MSNGDRIKYDYISGNECNVSEDEEAIAAFMLENSNDLSKVSILETATENGRNLKRIREVNGVKASGGKVKLKISVFRGTRRFKKKNLKDQAQIGEEARLQKREARMAERRANRAKLRAEQI